MSVKTIIWKYYYKCFIIIVKNIFLRIGFYGDYNATSWTFLKIPFDLLLSHWKT